MNEIVNTASWGGLPDFNKTDKQLEKLLTTINRYTERPSRRKALLSKIKSGSIIPQLKVALELYEKFEPALIKKKEELDKFPDDIMIIEKRRLVEGSLKRCHERQDQIKTAIERLEALGFT